MPRRRKNVAEPVSLSTQTDVYEQVVVAYRELWSRILAGVSTPKDRDELDKARQRAQTLHDAYPTLWEKACREVEK